VAALAVFLALPLAILDIVGEVRAEPFWTGVLEQFVAGHAFETLGRPLSIALLATYTRTACCLYEDITWFIIVRDIDASLAIDGFIGAMSDKDEILLHVGRPYQEKLHWVGVDIIYQWRVLEVHSLDVQNQIIEIQHN
jgi:hypothetical protein